jgi:hypothetical protein
MPRRVISAPQRKPRAQSALTPVERKGKTPDEFCQVYGIARRTFEKWKAKGLAPAVLQPGGPHGWQLITQESEDEWRRRHTTVAATISAAE